MQGGYVSRIFVTFQVHFEESQFRNCLLNQSILLPQHIVSTASLPSNCVTLNHVRRLVIIQDDKQLKLVSNLTAAHVSRAVSGFFFFLRSLTRCLPPAPLKLRPYGAIQICLLLLLLLLIWLPQFLGLQQLQLYSFVWL